MLTLLTGCLTGMTVLAAWRQHSWVLLIMTLLLLTSVTLSLTTGFWSVPPLFGVLIMLSATVLLADPLKHFHQLMQLSTLLTLHLTAAALTLTTSLVLLTVAVLLVVMIRMVRQQGTMKQLVLLALCLLSLPGTLDTLVVIVAVMLTIWLIRTLSQSAAGDQQSTTSVSFETAEDIRSKERSRIYQNIHDDVGADLLKLIYQTTDENQRLAIKNIMDRLREAVAQTTHRRLELSELLAEICTETAASCQAAGIDFEQQLSVDQHTVNLDLPTHLQRMIKELTTNSIKHAQATVIQLTARTEHDVLHLTFCDDGSGISADTNLPPGKGLLSLRRRALQHGATIDWQPANTKGTMVTLKVPLK